MRDIDGNPVAKAKVEILRLTHESSGNVSLFKYEEVTSNSQGRWAVREAPESLDGASKRVVQMLSTLDGATWLTPGDAPTLPRERTFIVASHLAHARAVEEKPELLDRILENLDSFLDRGELPVAEVATAEPMRSYIGALALLGDRIPRQTAVKFLREFSFDGDLDQLVIADLTSLDDESFRILRPVPMPSSREAISRVAASVAEEAGDLARAGVLLIDAGELRRGQELLERAAWRDCGRSRPCWRKRSQMR